MRATEKMNDDVGLALIFTVCTQSLTGWPALFTAVRYNESTRSTQSFVSLSHIISEHWTLIYRQNRTCGLIFNSALFIAVWRKNVQPTWPGILASFLIIPDSQTWFSYSGSNTIWSHLYLFLDYLLKFRLGWKYGCVQTLQQSAGACKAVYLAALYSK